MGTLYKICKHITEGAVADEMKFYKHPFKKPTTVRNRRYDPVCHISYISDIHLEYKIVNKFTSETPDEDIIDWVRMEAFSLADSLSNALDSYVIFGGDIVGHPKLAREFYQSFMDKYAAITRPYFATLMNVKYKDKRVYAVMGDLEVQFGGKLFYDAKSEFSSIFRKFGIVMLDNTLVWDNDVPLLGGIGYLNGVPQVNASLAMQEYKHFIEGYKRAVETVTNTKSDCPLIVVTHAPYVHRLAGEYQPNTIYISGHTHRNGLKDLGNDTVFLGDAQWGYSAASPKFRRHVFRKHHSTFDGITKGVHEVSLQQWCDYVAESDKQVKERDVVVKLESGAKLYLVRSRGISAFFMVDSESLYIVADGVITPISDGYCNTIEDIASLFDSVVGFYLTMTRTSNSYLLEVSDYIKSIGGTGRIDGWRAYVDAFCWVWIDPRGSGYHEFHWYAGGVGNSFPNLRLMLKYHCPAIYMNMGDTDLPQMKKMVGDTRALEEQGKSILRVNSPAVYDSVDAVKAVCSLITSFGLLYTWPNAAEMTIIRGK